MQQYSFQFLFSSYANKVTSKDDLTSLRRTTRSDTENTDDADIDAFEIKIFQVDI